MSNTPQTVESILLQFIAEYHQRLNELAGHGTPIEQATKAINALRRADMEHVIGKDIPGETNIMIAAHHVAQRGRMEERLK